MVQISKKIKKFSEKYKKIILEKNNQRYLDNIIGNYNLQDKQTWKTGYKVSLQLIYSWKYNFRIEFFFLSIRSFAKLACQLNIIGHHLLAFIFPAVLFVLS